MRVLVVGASGFIGRRVCRTLLARGHEVVAAGRGPLGLSRLLPGCTTIRGDLLSDGPDDWAKRLHGMDGVVNAAGAMSGNLDRLQASGPAALFSACAAVGVRHVVQISALGAGEIDTRFLATKARADREMLRLRDTDDRAGWCVVRPSLVIGRGGASTRLFCSLATMPFPVRLGPGTWKLQPIHVADLAATVADLLEADTVPAMVEAVGPEAVTTDELTGMLRTWLGMERRFPVGIPLALLRSAAAVGTAIPGSPLTADTLSTLAAGNTVTPGTDRTFGTPPRPLADALAAEPADEADKLVARVAAAMPVVRVLLASVWLGTAFVSAAVSKASNYALLASLGVHGLAASVFLYGGIAMDVAIGFSLLAWPRRTRAVSVVQIVVTVAFAGLATYAVPGAWVDPLGPLLKNAAILAASAALLAMADE